jgi:hydroxymethylbilane synthase
VKLVAGTRGSALAMTQMRLVIDRLRSLHPELDFEVRSIRTEGDIRADRPLSEIGGKGVFVKELELALQRGEIDFAVHSLKDVPALVSDGLTLAAVLPRADARDVLISRTSVPLKKLRKGAIVATGSRRREVQLRAIRPDLQIKPIRGNVDTRLRKLEEEQLDALILAAAGLIRLGKAERITEYMDPDVMLPAVGQGVLTVEARADWEHLPLIAALDDPPTRVVVTAERSYLARLGAGCELPVGAYGRLSGDRLTLDGMLAADDSTFARSRVTGAASSAADLGILLAEELISRLAEVRV